MTDRRVKKTQQALHESLIALIQEKGYDAVTVKDIIARANVGRSTFYAHYTDKETLLRGGLDQLSKLLVSRQREQADAVGLAFSRAIFEHAQGYRAVYRAMLGEHAGVVIADRMRKVLAHLVGNDLATRRPMEQIPEVPREALIACVVGAIMSLLTWWVDAKEEYSVDQLDAMFRRMMPAELA